MAMSPLESLAAGLGLVNIVLIARRTVWNYPFGIAMVCLYALIFYNAHLYSAAGLQIFFLASQIYGWWYWRLSHGGPGPVPVRVLGTRGFVGAVGSGIAGTFGLGLLMTHYTNDPAPWPDAANAVWSMVAQILTDRRHVESWPVWVGVNLLSIWLYASQGLLVTSALYALFLCIACWGWSEWRRAAGQLPMPGTRAEMGG
jgi:nicotinamide mononucleotide transporter